MSLPSALRLLSLYFPTGDVSGDFFNVFPIGEKEVGIFICDVMGHGVRSALITSMIRWTGRGAWAGCGRSGRSTHRG
jgi:serine phosphatase RsbU (regulator of sigma subunit)